MSIEIRNAKPSDAQTIADFQIAMALETENKQLADEVVKPAVDEVFIDASRGFYLVADDGESVVGSLMVTYEWSDWRNSNLWWIQSVFVTPENRSKGIFKSLYHRVIEMAKENDVMFVRLYVETENEKAQKVYESLGMKKMPYLMYDVKID